jgi:hypothetical protein
MGGIWVRLAPGRLNKPGRQKKPVEWRYTRITTVDAHLSAWPAELCTVHNRGHEHPNHSLSSSSGTRGDTLQESGTVFRESHHDDCFLLLLLLLRRRRRLLYADHRPCHRGGDGHHHPSYDGVCRRRILSVGGRQSHGLLCSVRVCRLACLRSAHCGRGPCRLCVPCRGGRLRVWTDGTSLHGVRNALERKERGNGMAEAS